jgi:hypothetical protein
MLQEMAGSWSDTKLWEAMAEDSSSRGPEVRSTLEPLLKTVSSVLSEAGTSGQSYTLHDAGHSFRVAERMVDVIPAEVFGSLSLYEHALLLLSAYLHDMGMTPEASRLTSHREFLLGNGDEELPESESDPFTAWLDTASIAYPADLSAHDAEWIVERYVRTRHIDWGEEWTLAQTDGVKSLGGYRTWKSDLCALCSSHGEGYAVLASPAFEPKTVESGSVVHLRYLALTLRMADVLEFDPERTPEAVYRHRAIDDSSKIFWYKDHDIALDIENAKRVRITARPTSALVHKAVEETAEDVNRELSLCRQIAENQHLQSLSGSEEVLPHRWDLPAKAWVDIRPAAGSYEYIDGAFRPNTDRVLELVAGTALYADPFAAVRELISNGFDAVRAAEAIERDKELTDGAAERRRHTLTLDLESIDGRWWLSCRDTGIGMDKGGIERHFLVAGSPLRSRLLDLARRSRERNDELERSGEFGIGVLSYFMLADKIAMTTREVDGTEGGWNFEIEELEGFGELRAADVSPGTTVRLRLREGLFEDVELWASELLDYLRGTIIRTPCAFEVSLEPLEDGSWKVEEGWTSNPDGFAANLLSPLVPNRSAAAVLELVGKQNRIEAERSSAEANEILEDVAGRLNWHVEEGRLEDELGSFRVCIPYWELDGGQSRMYMRVEVGTGKKALARSLDHLRYAGHAFIGGTTVRTSWYGMQVKDDVGFTYMLKSQVNGIVEINFDSGRAGDIQLRRDQAQLSEAGTKAMDALGFELHRISAKLSTEMPSASAYRSLNMVFGFGEGDDAEGDWRWLGPLKSDGEMPSWEAIRFPCISDAPLRSDEQRPSRATIQRKRVTVVPSLMDASEISTGLPWHGGCVPPDRLVRYERRDAPRADLAVGVMPLWRKPPATFIGEEPMVAECPPEWRMLTGVRWSSYGNVGPGFRSGANRAVVWNQGNPLASLAHNEAREWVTGLLNQGAAREEDWLATLASAVDPSQHEEALEDPANAAAWLLWLVSAGIGQLDGLWAGMAERHGDYLVDLWQRLGLPDTGEEASLGFVHAGDGDYISSAITRISPTTWTRTDLKTADDWAVLPLPGREWRLSIRADK